MRLVRYGPSGRERPGVIDAQGTLRDLSQHCATVGWDELSAAGLKRFAALRPESLPVVKGAPRLGVPFTGISKLIGIGLNYRDHAIEAGLPIPTEPIVFMKATTCISGPCDSILLPPGSVKTDWEVELSIVIGREAKFVSEVKALDHVAGYCVVNDVSERAYQFERGQQWDKGKGCDTFGPIGPWLVTKDEVPDPQALAMWTEVNGRRVQNGNTATMIFGCAEIVSYLSRFMTLLPGDVIATGTPPGVGMGMKPPHFLKAGDTVALGIDGLGEQRQTVLASASEAN